MHAPRRWLAATSGIVFVLAMAASLPGCVGALFAHRRTELELMTPDVDMRALRAMQTRRFEGVSESALRSAALSVLQDLGYQVASSDVQLGLIIGTRGNASFPFEEIPKSALQILKWELSLGYFPPPDDPKLTLFNGVAVVLAIEPTAGQETTGYSVRIQLHRFVRDRATQSIVWADELKNARDYETFFSMLSKAISLGSDK